MSGLYLAINAAVLSVPLAFSWHRRLRFADRWPDFWPACFTVAAGFIAWDVFFTRWGVWGFDDRFLVGYRLAGLPLEEWLFFICIPYACVFTYHAFGTLGATGPGRRAAASVTAVALAVSVFLVALHPARLYTSVTGTLLAAFLAWLLWRKPAWTGRFWLSLAVLAVPFVISNGVLTGLRFWDYPVLNFSPERIAGQVVWYDNAQNLGTRVFSIPLDDFLYATLLIGLNVALMEWLSSRRQGRAA